LATIRLRHIVAALAAIAALAAATAGPATAAGIRVEGPRGTVFQGTVRPFVGTLRDTDGTAHTTKQSTALGALVTASRTRPFPLTLSWFDCCGGGWAGFFVKSVNGVLPPPTAFWAVKVDQKLLGVGAGAWPVTASSRVLVYYSTFDAQGHTQPTLGINLSDGHVAVGQPVTVTVNQFDDAGSSMPAAGAWIWVNGVGTQVDATGHAVIRLGKPGLYAIRATKQGTIRSRTVWVRAVSS